MSVGFRNSFRLNAGISTILEGQPINTLFVRAISWEGAVQMFN
jgi:hypothetical protein